MDVERLICNYISTYWIKDKSQRGFALDHNIDESTVRKIKKEKGYRIPLTTLSKICEAENISLSDFLKKLGL